MATFNSYVENRQRVPCFFVPEKICPASPSRVLLQGIPLIQLLSAFQQEVGDDAIHHSTVEAAEGLSLAAGEARRFFTAAKRF